MGNNSMEATKNIFYVEGEGAIDKNTVTRWFMNFCFGFKNFDNQARSGKSKCEDSNTVLQAREVNPMSNTWRVSDKVSISRVQQGSSPSQPQQKYLEPHITKILKNFWLTQVKFCIKTKIRISS